MSSKLAGYKIKWLVIGLLTGIFFTTFLPQFPFTTQVKEEKDNLSIHTQSKPLEYSQWPPFLTDPTFDLVNISLSLLLIE